MPRYQLRRPSPVRIIPRQVRRQVPTASTAPPVPEEEEVEEGPESPDSPFSSPSTVGALSEGEDSESEDEAEPPSPVESGATVPATEAPGATSTGAALPETSPAADSGQTTLQASALPTFTPDITSQSTTNAALPQITATDSPTDTATRPSLTTTGTLQTSLVSRPERPPTSSSSLSPPPPPPPPPNSDTAGDSGAPQRSLPRPDAPLMTKGAAVAATVLGVLGAVALILGAIVIFKRRKRRQHAYNQRLADDAFNPGNTGSLHAPETAHVGRGVSFLHFRGGGTNNNDSHLTRSSDRSNTLFGPAAYSRPETVSTDRNAASRIPPTPNPFADPPLNKAYDVLAGRPRSTTLTDRGSWIKNPFRDPESERFDPFGELHEKARKERVRHMEEVRREAEFQREREMLETEKQFAAKERMGLTPDGLPVRKGSSVTVEGLGVLDRSGSGQYR